MVCCSMPDAVGSDVLGVPLLRRSVRVQMAECNGLGAHTPQRNDAASDGDEDQLLHQFDEGDMDAHSHRCALGDGPRLRDETHSSLGPFSIWVTDLDPDH